MKLIKQKFSSLFA